MDVDAALAQCRCRSDAARRQSETAYMPAMLRIRISCCRGVRVEHAHACFQRCELSRKTKVRAAEKRKWLVDVLVRIAEAAEAHH